MRYPKIPTSFFTQNRIRLATKMDNSSVAVLTSNDRMFRNGDQNHTFRQNSDLFYLTGIEQEDTKLLLKKNDLGEISEFLFILKPDPTLEIWEGHKLTQDEAKDISGVKNIRYLSDFESVVSEHCLSSEHIYLNTNENIKHVSPFRTADLRLIEALKQQFPLHNFKRLAPILRDLRLIKQPEEIELIKKACQMTADAFHRVLKFVKPDVMEYEIEAEITHEFIRQGANGHAYEPIVASGKDNCALHYVKNDKPCASGDLILLDFGAEYAGYAADTTRTIPANGKFTPRQRAVYEAVYRVLNKAKTFYKVGTTIAEINEQVNEIIYEELVQLGLAPQVVNPYQHDVNTIRRTYYMHGVAHFMGLDVHDVGTRDTILQAGMVLSCEPAIYIADEGFGIRLENDILITEDGCEDLLSFEPLEIEQIEQLMQKNI